jgi:hypothetical protein
MLKIISLFMAFLSGSTVKTPWPNRPRRSGLGDVKLYITVANVQLWPTTIFNAM